MAVFDEQQEQEPDGWEKRGRALHDAADQMLLALDGRRNLGPEVNRCRALLKRRMAALLELDSG